MGSLPSMSAYVVRMSNLNRQITLGIELQPKYDLRCYQDVKPQYTNKIEVVVGVSGVCTAV